MPSLVFPAHRPTRDGLGFAEAWVPRDEGACFRCTNSRAEALGSCLRRSDGNWARANSTTGISYLGEAKTESQSLARCSVISDLAE